MMMSRVCNVCDSVVEKLAARRSSESDSLNGDVWLSGDAIKLSEAASAAG